MYPVGSIYLSTDANFNPNTAFGGTWQKIENMFLLGSGSRGVGATGGEENVTLNINQIPSHNHGSRGSMNIRGTLKRDYGAIVEYSGGATGAFRSSNNGGVQIRGQDARTMPLQVDFDASAGWSGSGDNAGGGGSHTNMPPYIVVAMWRRTA